LLPNQSSAAGGFVAETMGAVFSCPSGFDLTTLSLPAALAQLNSTAWALDATFGILPGTSDFFENMLRDQNGSGKIEYSEYATLNYGSKTGYEAGGFSVLINKITNGPNTLLKVPTEDLMGNQVGFSDIAILPSTTLIQGTSIERSNGWVFADQAQAALNPTPEPTSVLIWTLFGLVIGWRAWRVKFK
jgi:hypothetical protein